MKLKKTIYIAVGCLSTALGAVGTVLPLLPTVPFLLLAAFCFARSSERLHTWFVGTALYRKHLESYVEGRGMTRGTKVRIMVLVTALMLLGFVMMDRIVVGQIVLGVIWVLHLLYFLFGVKTISA